MGWSFDYSIKSRKALIDDIVGRYRDSKDGFEVIKHRAIGNHLWMVIKTPAGRKIVALYLLSGSKDDGWGYKDMTESCGPVQLDCPLSFLAAADTPTEQFAIDWREKVVAYHKQKKQKDAGAVVEYGGRRYSLDTKLGRRGWSVTEQESGIVYRMTCQQVNQSQVISTSQ